MKNIRGQARRGQEGLGTKERRKERERERMKKGGREREKGRDWQKTHLAAKDRSPEGESVSLLSLSSRLSKDVSFLLLSLFVFSYRSRLHHVAFNVSFEADKLVSVYRVNVTTAIPLLAVRKQSAFSIFIYVFFLTTKSITARSQLYKYYFSSLGGLLVFKLIFNLRNADESPSTSLIEN